MKKKRILALLLVLSLLLASAALAVGCGSKKSENIELSLTLHDPATAFMGQFLQAWADDVSQRTDGGLTIKIYGSGSLAPATEALNFVMDGTADIGWLFAMYYPGQFPLTQVITLPMNGPVHPAQTADVLWDLYESTPEMRAEIDSKIHVLTMYGNPGNFVSTTNKPIKTIDDIKGMKLRCPAGGMTDVMMLWGASPEAVSPTDCYDALQKGNIAGTSWEWQGINAFKLWELLDYYTNEMIIYEGVFLLGMNNDKWNSLPQEYKDVLTETTGRAGSIATGDAFFAENERCKQIALSENPNAQLITPAPEAVAEFKAIADEYAASWAAKNSTSTFDAQVFLNNAQASAEKHKR